MAPYFKSTEASAPFSYITLALRMDAPCFAATTGQTIVPTLRNAPDSNTCTGRMLLTEAAAPRSGMRLFWSRMTVAMPTGWTESNSRSRLEPGREASLRAAPPAMMGSKRGVKVGLMKAESFGKSRRANCMARYNASFAADCATAKSSFVAGIVAG